MDCIRVCLIGIWLLKKHNVYIPLRELSHSAGSMRQRIFGPGSRYVGTVSIVDTNGVFVSLEGGIICLRSCPKRGRPPRGAWVTGRIIGVNHENNRIWGVITHMTTAR